MLAPNSLIQGRYRIGRQLAKGGMGTVYAAHDERLNIPVALKACHFQEADLREQFAREARILARLKHPALARVIDQFDEGGELHLVMDFVEGDDLLKMIHSAEAAYDLSDVLRWADQLLDALEYLHGQQPPIVHRDIKPQNLKLWTGGNVVLLDFGLAKTMAQTSRITSSGSIFGYTPHYAPIEQIQGARTDPRSDLYALGATLYHLLTRTMPPDAVTRVAAITDGLPDPIQSANDVNRDVPGDVAEIITRAMTTGRSGRYASAKEMRQALRSVAAPALKPVPSGVATVVVGLTADTVPLPPFEIPTVQLEPAPAEIETLKLPPRNDEPPLPRVSEIQKDNRPVMAPAIVGPPVVPPPVRAWRKRIVRASIVLVVVVGLLVLRTFFNSMRFAVMERDGTYRAFETYAKESWRFDPTDVSFARAARLRMQYFRERTTDLQRELASRGLFSGQQNGVFGQDTIEALKKADIIVTAGAPDEVNEIVPSCALNALKGEDIPDYCRTKARGIAFPKAAQPPAAPPGPPADPAPTGKPESGSRVSPGTVARGAMTQQRRIRIELRELAKDTGVGEDFRYGYISMKRFGAHSAHGEIVTSAPPVNNRIIVDVATGVPHPFTVQLRMLFRSDPSKSETWECSGTVTIPPGRDPLVIPLDLLLHKGSGPGSMDCQLAGAAPLRSRQ